MKASEARTQWKDLLDRAVSGEVIKFTRGGVTFYLGTSEGMHEGQKRIVDSAMTLGAYMEKEKNKSVPQAEELQGPVMVNSSTPIKRQVKPTGSMCKVHGVDKVICKLMKH